MMTEPACCVTPTQVHSLPSEVLAQVLVHVDAPGAHRVCKAWRTALSHPAAAVDWVVQGLGVREEGDALARAARAPPPVFEAMVRKVLPCCPRPQQPLPQQLTPEARERALQVLGSALAWVVARGDGDATFERVLGVCRGWVIPAPLALAAAMAAAASRGQQLGCERMLERLAGGVPSSSGNEADKTAAITGAAQAAARAGHSILSLWLQSQHPSDLPWPQRRDVADSILDAAASQGQTDTVLLLLQHLPNLSWNSSRHALEGAARHGHLATCEALLHLLVPDTANLDGWDGWRVHMRLAVSAAAGAGRVGTCRALVQLLPAEATPLGRAQMLQRAVEAAARNGQGAACRDLMTAIPPGLDQRQWSVICGGAAYGVAWDGHINGSLLLLQESTATGLQAQQATVFREVATGLVMGPRAAAACADMLHRLPQLLPHPQLVDFFRTALQKAATHQRAPALTSIMLNVPPSLAQHPRVLADAASEAVSRCAWQETGATALSVIQQLPGCMPYGERGRVVNEAITRAAHRRKYGTSQALLRVLPAERPEDGYIWPALELAAAMRASIDVGQGQGVGGVHAWVAHLHPDLVVPFMCRVFAATCGQPPRLSMERHMRCCAAGLRAALLTYAHARLSASQAEQVMLGCMSGAARQGCVGACREVMGAADAAAATAEEREGKLARRAALAEAAAVAAEGAGRGRLAASLRDPSSSAWDPQHQEEGDEEGEEVGVLSEPTLIPLAPRPSHASRAPGCVRLVMLRSGGLSPLRLEWQRGEGPWRLVDDARGGVLAASMGGAAGVAVAAAGVEGGGGELAPMQVEM